MLKHEQLGKSTQTISVPVKGPKKDDEDSTSDADSDSDTSAVASSFDGWKSLI